MFLSENLRKGILHLGGGTGKHCQTAWAALGTSVLAHLAHHLGADRAGDINVSVSVLDVHGGALGVLVVLGLGGVLDTLDGLDDILA